FAIPRGDLMKKIVLSALCALAVCATGPAMAEYPDRPITVVTGYNSGGVGSAITRLFTDHLSKRLGQPIIVQDKPGASGSIGVRTVLTAAPDGYTFFSGGLNMHPLIYKNGLDLGKELEAVTMIAAVPLAFLTSTAYPLENVEDVA